MEYKRQKERKAGNFKKGSLKVLAVVQIGINSGIQLVSHLGVMRAANGRGCPGGSIAAPRRRGDMPIIRVNARVNPVGEVGAVRRDGARTSASVAPVVVTKTGVLTVGGMRTDAGASSAHTGARPVTCVVCTSTSQTRVVRCVRPSHRLVVCTIIAVRVDAGIGFVGQTRVVRPMRSSHGLVTGPVVTVRINAGVQLVG